MGTQGLEFRCCTECNTSFTAISHASRVTLSLGFESLALSPLLFFNPSISLTCLLWWYAGPIFPPDLIPSTLPSDMQKKMAEFTVKKINNLMIALVDYMACLMKIDDGGCG